MRKFKKIAAAVLAASMAAAMALTCFAASPKTGPGMTDQTDSASASDDDDSQSTQPVLYTGSVSSVGSDQIVMNHEIDDGTEIVNVNITEYTRIVDGADGTPLELTDIQDGASVNIYIGPALMLSYPPIANAVMVIVGAPSGEPAPVYTRIESIEQEERTYWLTTSDGNQYVVNGRETDISPYLTKNIVKADDLKAGMDVLLWPASNGSPGVSKVIVFGDVTSEKTNWTWTGEVWTYSIDGVMQTGWVQDENDGRWYYLDPSTGAMQKSCFITENGNTYYLTDDGSMLTDARTFTPDLNGALH